MTETCMNCEYKEECEQFGFEMEQQDRDECEHYYGFSEEYDDGSEN